jgi:hypothetical protein
MANWAVALVALLTVRGPLAPAAPPPTEIPGPKFAVVAPWKKFENEPVIVTLKVCPGFPNAGESSVIDAGGLIVKVELFVLANGEPCSAAPDMDTRYAVGLVTSCAEET